MKKTIYLAFTLLVLFLLPCAAFGQDSEAVQNDSVVQESNALIEDASKSLKTVYTKEDNFGGFRFVGNVSLGAGRCDDYAFCSGHEMEINEEHYNVAGLLQAEFGFFWGRRVYFGPTLSISVGYPMFVNGAINIKMYVPFADNNAVSLSAGFGGTFHVGYVNTEYHDDDNELNYMYVPIQLGYEHVFDSRFILGASLQANIAFSHKENGSNDPILGILAAGVNLGYKF